MCTYTGTYVYVYIRSVCAWVCVCRHVIGYTYTCVVVTTRGSFCQWSEAGQVSVVSRAVVTGAYVTMGVAGGSDWCAGRQPVQLCMGVYVPVCTYV